jgi:hypothetical protein
MDAVADGGLSIDIIGPVGVVVVLKVLSHSFHDQGIILGWVCNHGCLGDIGRLHSR